MEANWEANKVLVVDDETDIRETIQEALELYGISAVIAANGHEALNILATRNDIGLILLDLMMPVMDGKEFMEKRRLIPIAKDIPVVLVSANREIDLNGFKVEG